MHMYVTWIYSNFYKTTFERKQDPKFDIAFLLETNLAKVKQKQYRSN